METQVSCPYCGHPMMYHVGCDLTDYDGFICEVCGYRGTEPFTVEDIIIPISPLERKEG